MTNIYKLYAIRFFFYFHLFSAVLVPFYTLWGSLTLKHVFWINAWFWLWNVLLEVPTGSLADYLGRKYSLILGSILAGLGAFIYSWVPHVGVFLFAEILFAMGFSLHSGSDEAMAYDSLIEIKKESLSKKILSQMEAYKLAGITVSALMGSFIAKYWGLQMPMRLFVIPAFICTLVGWSLKEPRFHVQKIKPSYKQIFKEGLNFFFQHKIVLLLTIEFVLTNAIVWIIIWIFQPLLSQAGLDIQFFGIVHALSGLGQILILTQVHRFEKWFRSRKNVLLFMTMSCGLCFIGLGIWNHLGIVIVLILGIFMFGFPRIPIYISYINKYIPSTHRATILSMTSMFRAIAIVVLNLIVGWLTDFSLNGTMVLLGVILILVMWLSKLEEQHLMD